MTVAAPCKACKGPVAHGRHLMPGSTCTETDIAIPSWQEQQQNIADAFADMKKRRKRKP